MKEINFINPLHPKQQQELNQWLRISVMLSVGLVVCMLAYTSKQLYVLRAIKQEQKLHAHSMKTFNATMERKQQLKKQEQTLKEHVALINSYRSSAIANYLEHMHKVFGVTAHMQSCNIQDKNMQLVFACANTQQATTIMQQLAQPTYVQDIKLVSLQPKQHGAATMLHISLQGRINA